LPSTHMLAWLGVKTKIRARAISDRGTLVLNNSRTGTTMRVQFEERREKQLAGGNPRNSPRASYTFPARDTTKLRAGESDAGADAPVPSISVLIKGHAQLDRKESIKVIETLAPEHYRETHIPGALNIPPEKIKETGTPVVAHQGCGNRHQLREHALTRQRICP